MNGDNRGKICHQHQYTIFIRNLGQNSPGTGNDMQSIPIIAQHEPAILPPKLTGILSPYPTVVIVINDHHIPSGIDLICLALLSSEVILIQFGHSQ